MPIQVKIHHDYEFQNSPIDPLNAANLIPAKFTFIDEERTWSCTTAHLGWKEAKRKAQKQYEANKETSYGIIYLTKASVSPFLNAHLCPDWDYLLITKNSPEFDSCTCKKV